MRKSILLSLAAAMLAGCQESWQERVRRETATMSLRQCPHYVTRGLIADSIAYDPASNRRTDFFTLIDSLIDTSMLTPENLEAAHAGLADEIRQNMNLLTLKQHRASFHFVYRLQSTGQVVIADSVTAAEY